jgi:hypothetical protein
MIVQILIIVTIDTEATMSGKTKIFFQN